MVLELPDGVADQRGDRQEAVTRRGPPGTARRTGHRGAGPRRARRPALVLLPQPSWRITLAGLLVRCLRPPLVLQPGPDPGGQPRVFPAQAQVVQEGTGRGPFGL